LVLLLPKQLIATADGKPVPVIEGEGMQQIREVGRIEI